MINFLKRSGVVVLLFGHSVLVMAEGENSLSERLTDRYSRLQTDVELAMEGNSGPCDGEQCAKLDEFRARVQEQGARASVLAYTYYPELRRRIPEFQFEVVKKAGLGASSDASGRVMLYEGLAWQDLSDDALCFVIMREMGHAVEQHHVSNLKTKLAITALASILFPAALLVTATNTATQAGTATTVASSMASSATSLLGTEAALSIQRPKQQVEADQVAIQLANLTKMDLIAVAAELRSKVQTGNWQRLLNASAEYLQLYAESLPVVENEGVLVNAPVVTH